MFMDPNLIHLDWERTGEALMMIIIIAFVVERALAVFFENRFYITHVSIEGIKELIAVIVAIAVCVFWKFDAIGMIILSDTTSIPGYALTGLVVAGGSKASIKLFRDIMNIKGTAYTERHMIRAQKASDDLKVIATDVTSKSSPLEAAAAVKRVDTILARAKVCATKSDTPQTDGILAEAEKLAKSVRATAKKIEDANK